MMVQFVFPAKDIRRTAAMPAPKKVELKQAWFKSAQEAISDIPKLNVEPDFWREHNFSATLNYVSFVLLNNRDERCHVVIDRKASSLEAR